MDELEDLMRVGEKTCSSCFYVLFFLGFFCCCFLNKCDFIHHCATAGFVLIVRDNVLPLRNM